MAFEKIQQIWRYIKSSAVLCDFTYCQINYLYIICLITDTCWDLERN